MGVTLGLSMDGNKNQLVFKKDGIFYYMEKIPQLINHVDKFKIMAGLKKINKPKIIIRTGVGSQRPFYILFINFNMLVILLKPSKKCPRQ